VKIVTVVGARPQLIKAAAVSKALRARHREILVHTGQHYDEGMSGRFFAELGLPEPDLNLGVGSGPHGRQTALMLQGIEELLLAERPDWLLVYGDTNSTIAGALAAAKLHVPVAHVEAGLRSFNRRMPEEINRVLTDHVSTLLFCPTDAAVANLAREGIVRGVIRTGDVMCDTLDAMRPAIARDTTVQDLGLVPGEFVVATIHRAENTDDPARLRAILDGLGATGLPVLFPVHPRTARLLDAVPVPANVRRCEPLGYVPMMALVSAARVVVTDSGGLQKEAVWLSTPCVTVRDETEWVETVTSGWNVLAGADAGRIASAVAGFVAAAPSLTSVSSLGGASAQIIGALEDLHAGAGSP